jgi:hypothetical protein
MAMIRATDDRLVEDIWDSFAAVEIRGHCGSVTTDVAMGSIRSIFASTALTRVADTIGPSVALDARGHGGVYLGRVVQGGDLFNLRRRGAWSDIDLEARTRSVRKSRRPIPDEGRRFASDAHGAPHGRRAVERSWCGRSVTAAQPTSRKWSVFVLANSVGNSTDPLNVLQELKRDLGQRVCRI